MRTTLRLVVCAAGVWIGSFTSAWSEETKPAASEIQACHCQGQQGPAADRIRAALEQPLHSSGLEFTEEPLENIVNFLQDEYDIPIQLDRPALEDAGMTTDEPLHVNLRNVSLKSALRLMLRTKNLTYMIRDEVLIITTPEEAEAELVACVYDVRDLLSVDKKGNKDFDAVIDMLVCCVATETWAENGGGEAEIRPLQPGLLVISQTQAVHEEIGGLLGIIRSTLSQPVAGTHAPVISIAPAIVVEPEFVDPEVADPDTDQPAKTEPAASSPPTPAED